MTTYTKTELENTPYGLLENIAREIGCTNYAHKRRSFIIDKILARQEELMSQTPTELNFDGIGFEMSVISDNLGAKDEEAEVLISCGASEDKFKVVGQPISKIINFLKNVLNIPTNSKILVDDVPVGKDYVVKPGDSIEFVKPSGSKGVN